MTGSRLLGPAEVRALARELDLRPTKRLGQNFVHDPNTVRRIVSAAGLRADDVVLEVGPGLGSLTLALLPSCRALVAVEIDGVLAQIRHANRASGCSAVPSGARGDCAPLVDPDGCGHDHHAGTTRSAPSRGTKSSARCRHISPRPHR